MIFKAFLILLIIQTSLGYQTFVQLMSKYKTKDFVFDLDNHLLFLEMEIAQFVEQQLHRCLL